MSEPLSVDVVVLTYNRPALLERCLSHLHSAIDKEFHVYLGINGPDEESLKVANRWREKFSHFQILPSNERLLPGFARNALVREGKSNWIYFLDDDAYPPKDIFVTLRRLVSSYPKVDVIGGPNLVPDGVSHFQKTVDRVLQNRFATWFSQDRYVAKGSTRIVQETSLILCNLAFRRSAWPKSGFPRDLACCEEGWILNRMSLQDSTFLYDPPFFVYHERRGSLRSFVDQVFLYGYGRGQMLKTDMGVRYLPHFIPAASVLYAILFPILAWIWPQQLFYFAIPFFVYSSLHLFLIVRELRKSGRRGTFRVSALIFLLHIYYGSGLMRGVLVRKPRS